MAANAVQKVSWRYRPWVMVWPIAFAQLVSWGCIYYAFAVFIVPLENQFAWSKPSINLALSSALLVLAAVTYPVARYLDRHGGLVPMSLAALGAALLFVLLAQIDSYLGFFILWLGLGVCMSALLYEPAFAVISQAFGTQARTGITALTLVAGFSSTVFIPFTEFALQSLGWRDTYLLLAVIMLSVVLPIHLLFVPARRSRFARNNGQEEVFRFTQLLGNPIYWGLATWAAFHAFMLVGLFFQLVPWLKSEGVPAKTIVIAIAVMGPMQVTGRVLVMMFARNLSAAIIGVVTAAMFPIAVYILSFGEKSLFVLCVAIGLFGMANGITTILRGAIPSEWFKNLHYAKIAGAIAVPAITLGAIAPFALAFIWEFYGKTAMLLLTLAVSVGSFGAFGAACLVHHRRQAEH